MTTLSLFNAMHSLDDCARSSATVHRSLLLTLGVQPAFVAPFLVLFLYAYAFSTGLKVRQATQRAKATGEHPPTNTRMALVAQLKDSTQTAPVASFHFWLAFSLLAWSCTGLVVSVVAVPVAALLLPVSVLIIVAIKLIYWLAGPLERALPRADQCYGVDLGAGLTTWLNELHDSSFAPGGFSLDATLRSPMSMVVETRTIRRWRRSGSAWALLAPACARDACVLRCVAHPPAAARRRERVGGGGRRARGGLCSELDSLAALWSLEWRWPELLDIDAILEFVQAPLASLEAVVGYVLGLAWYLNLSYTELLEGASQLLVLNSVLAVVKPMATAAAKVTPVLTQMMTRAKGDQIGAIGFGECVPSEVEGLLAKIGMSRDEVMSRTELDWSGKRLNAGDMGVLKRLLEKKYDAADAQPWRQLGGRCGRVVPRVGAREEYDAADAQPSRQLGGRCGRVVPRVGAREEYDAADAQPWLQLGGRCGRVVPRVGAREEYDAADAQP